ncbi:MAG: tail fiber domain-containing protein [Flavobacteriales bacterium]|nr:tail fiber domain-containing protein [Flavobacteriales bacterium]
MKLRNLFFIFTTLFVIRVHAQLKVNTNGSVKIGSATPYPSGGDLLVAKSGQTEMRIFSTTTDISRLWTINGLFAYGLGVDENGAGHIYKNINGPSPIMTFFSWGYVGIGRAPSYKLDVDGDLRVNTTIYSSDSRFKENVIDITEDSSLYKLRGISYNFKKNDMIGTDLDTKTLNPNKIIGKK